MLVTFFLPGEADLGRLGALDPDRDPTEFRLGERAWILQTFLRLRAAGAEVRLADHVPDRGIVVFHAKHEEAFLAAHPRRGRALLVGIRGDLFRPLAAEVEIVQNGCFANRGTRHFVPHWPQPALMCRDPSRGSRLERLAYKGNLDNLHPDFLGEPWRAALAARGIEWIVDGKMFDGETIGRAPLAWHDYSSIDALLAVRPASEVSDSSKPATKLANCWLAGVPAILGAESAYRELRRSELDFLEVSSVAEAECALDRLRAEPRLYSEMVANGVRRAAEVDVAAVTRCWLELLGAELPRRARSPRRRALRRLPLARRIALRRFALRFSGLPLR